MSLAILLLGGAAIATMPVDIFPYIDIPVVSVVWSYNGIPPEEMEKRIVTIFERAMTTTVNDIEHIESQSYYGVAVVRVYFSRTFEWTWRWPRSRHRKLDSARYAARHLPPNILKYDASSVPVLQLGLESKNISEQQLFDIGQNYVRTRWRPFRARRFRCPMAARCAKSWLTSIGSFVCEAAFGRRCF